VLDIRTYRTVPGGREEFLRIMADEAVPMLRRYGIEVVAFGPAVQDDDHAILIRFFISLEERKRQLERFYGSEEWLTHHDPRVTVDRDVPHGRAPRIARRGGRAFHPGRDRGRRFSLDADVRPAMPAPVRSAIFSDAAAYAAILRTSAPCDRPRSVLSSSLRVPLDRCVHRIVRIGRMGNACSCRHDHSS